MNLIKRTFLPATLCVLVLAVTGCALSAHSVTSHKAPASSVLGATPSHGTPANSATLVAVGNPLGRMWYDTAPCPTSNNCRQSTQAPPVGADGIWFKTTDYFEGATFQVLAGSRIASRHGSPPSFLASVAIGQGFLALWQGGAKQPLVFPLPMDRGVPTLTKAVGPAGYPVLLFHTSSGATGSLEVESKKLTWSLPEWKIGPYTVAIWRLPTVDADPLHSWQFFAVEGPVTYYAPESNPSELLAATTSGTTKVASLSCDQHPGPHTTPPDVTPTGGPFLAVQCKSQVSGAWQGILVDTSTGQTWTLWRGGSVPIPVTFTSPGWAYFIVANCEACSTYTQGTLDLVTGGTGPLPRPMLDPNAPLSTPSGKIYFFVPSTDGGPGEGPGNLGPGSLYRVDGPSSTQVATLPELPWGIDDGGAIWEPEPGGTVVAASGMNIQVWNPRVEVSRELTTGPGYEFFLGPGQIGGDAALQVSVASGVGQATVTLGTGSVLDTIATTDGVIFRDGAGGWFVATVRGP